MEDNIMFVILSILVLIATMNIVSGLIMLVKNKSRDIGILRTMGLSEGAVLRVFFICGSAIGVAGTVAGVALGCAFAIWIDPIFDFVNWMAGGGSGTRRCGSCRRCLRGWNGATCCRRCRCRWGCRSW
jgi:lipoprotein-releasing system permease protein